MISDECCHSHEWVTTNRHVYHMLLFATLYVVNYFFISFISKSNFQIVHGEKFGRDAVLLLVFLRHYTGVRLQRSL